jgi:uncharacterized FlaG/YvyC family protein
VPSAVVAEAKPREAALVPPAPHERETALDALNERLAGRGMEARYSVDERTKLVVISLVNADSGEVLKRFPNEAVTRLTAALSGRAAGPHLVDEKA